MGKQKIGKLYLHWSKRGIAYKWGEDGEIHRFSFGQSAQKDNQRVYYADDAEYGDRSYEGGGYEAGYDAYGAPYYEEPSRFSILWEHPWLFWVLLVVFPPLGIWVLWKRNQYDTLIQGAISAVSLIWFVILLVWIITGITRSSGDPTKQPDQINVANIIQPTPTTLIDNALNIPTTAPTAIPGGTDEDDSGDNDLLQNDDDGLTTTPTGDLTTPVDEASVHVYTASTGSGTYYHKNDICNNVPYSNHVTLKYAKEQGLTQCPTCYGSGGTEGTTTDTTTYYATSGGSYYHLSQTCSGMKNARPISKEQAIKDGKSACQTCTISYYYTEGGTYYHNTSSCSGMNGAKRVTLQEAIATKKPACPKCIKKSSGSSSSTETLYYSTRNGKYYHKKETCSGMTNASKVSLTVAKQRNQTACPVCIGSGDDSSTQKYYATKSGTYYHAKSTCSGMKNATAISLTAAKKANKKACPVCLNPSSSGGTYYATKDGQYYHSNQTCSGMKDATKITLATAKKYGKDPCPTCLSAPSTYVYMTNSGKYYHAKSGCGGMTGAKRVAISTAKESGKTACPICIGGATPTPSPTRTPSPNNIDAKTYCYASEGNKYFHKTSGCSGMINATRMTVQEAKSRGKKVCPTCQARSPLPSATTEPTVYGTSGNKYYHSKKDCSGMTNAVKLTLSNAKSKKLTACPVCIKNNNVTQRTIEPSCYISSGDGYYHAKRSCPLTSSASKTKLSKAKDKGKTACPYCAGSSLDTMVFVSSKGSLYHSKSSCNGTQMDIKACLSEAVNKGYKRCSRCSPPRVTSKPSAPAESPTITPGPTIITE